MSSIRQNKIETAIQKELSVFFQQHARTYTLGNMVSVTTVNITSDLSLARIYLSVFGSAPAEDVLKNIEDNSSKIRSVIATALKNMKRLPDFRFKIDDSLDYAEKIDELLKK